MELLAPGGDADSIKAAIAAGADAVYCGLNRFNARNRAENISIEDLKELIPLAHSRNCEIFLTLNIIVLESEIPAVIKLLNNIVNTGIDGIIVQDLGIIYILKKYFPKLNVHASTQLTTHNDGQIAFLAGLGASRVNLCRELNIHEIRILTEIAHKNGMEVEVFVHGSYCICFSGLCYMSSYIGGSSGNRGRCSQPCRDRFARTESGSDYPLNLKDNSAYTSIGELHDAGVDSLKIEGRIKKFHYVYAVVEAYRKQLDRLYGNDDLDGSDEVLYKVFNRDFSKSFLTGSIGKNLFIDNPRDHSALHIYNKNEVQNDELLDIAKKKIYEDRTELIGRVSREIDHLNHSPQPVYMSVTGKPGECLKVNVRHRGSSFDIESGTPLSGSESKSLDRTILMSRIGSIDSSFFYLDELKIDKLEPGLFLPFRELASMKKKILFLLNGSIKHISPAEVPVIRKVNHCKKKASLSVIISSPEDLNFCSKTDAAIYFKLPDSLKGVYPELKELLKSNPDIIPWFPAVLIGADYEIALELLKLLKPEVIVTDNSGIAFAADEAGIDWIAGPNFNIVNSYSLILLSGNYRCKGAFISGEIKSDQIKRIKAPENFDLYYIMYNPIELVTSRACLFSQVKGCHKELMDSDCTAQCIRSAIIEKENGEAFVIDKQKGNYNRIYAHRNFLNKDIVLDIPDLFTSFFMDLRDIKTGTDVICRKQDLIRLFEKVIERADSSQDEIFEKILKTTDIQYKRGI